MLSKILLIFIICLSTSVAAQTKPITIFVSIPPQKQFVEKIGAGHVDVRVMLPPGQSPETFSPSPKLLVGLSGSKLYFQIGVPFENDWSDSLLSANKSLKIITCCDRIITTEVSAMEDEHQDLHIWSSPVMVKALVKQIQDELILIDPVHADEYSANYNAFIAELNELDRVIRQKLATRRTNNFIVSHAAWGYFAEEYGLEQVSLERNGKESGPKSLSNIIRLAHQEGIHTLFVVEQYKTPFVDSLARELDAVIVELDPLAEDYLGNMRLISDRIAGALQ